MQEDEKRIAVINPYDVVGKAHNKGLDYVVEKLNAQEDIKIERVVELVSQYIASLRGEAHSDECKDIKEDFIFGYVAIGRALNMMSSYSVKELLQKGEFNEKQKCFVESILNVSEDRALDREGTLKILLNIEEQILASDLSEKELQIPLLTVSIAKYSVKYFIEQMKNDGSEWKNFIEGDLSNFRWPWKADGKGAVTGAIGGITGGAGGVIIGALAGAIGGSVASALGLA